MADPDLKRQGPLDSHVLPLDRDVSVTGARAAARFILRGDAAAAAIAGKAYGLPLPGTINRAEGAEKAALMIGPDEWLLIEPGGDAEAIAARLSSALAGRPHSLVDVSHRQTGLVLERRDAALLLAAGCPLDLRLPAFPVGMATRTIFLKAEIILWRRAPDQFHLEVWRSFAPYLAGHLVAARAGAPAG